MNPPPGASADRIRSLDITRGFAVMGIFSVNVIGMAMVRQAYFYPPAFGFDDLADKLTWLVNFILVDGKLRSLFSIMFGASTMLVIERAAEAGRSGWKTHYARMIVLMGIGFAHFLFLWWGDILTHYAAVGMLLYPLSRLSGFGLFYFALVGLVLNAGDAAYRARGDLQLYARIDSGHLEPGDIERRDDWVARSLPAPQAIAKDKADHASLGAHVAAARRDGLAWPFYFGILWPETLSLMLLGMAAFKSGFLTGQWSRKSYAIVAAIGLGGGLVGYAAFGAWVWRSDFALPVLFGATEGFSVLLRPVMAVGYAALVIVATRRPGWLGDRMAAVGRAAFTNYLGCTLIGTALFFGTGIGLYDQLSRFEAWLLVPPTWLLMLAWSKPWLDRFHYGPLEWLWRSLARGRFQPMRRAL